MCGLVDGEIFVGVVCCFCGVDFCIGVFVVVVGLFWFVVCFM